MLTADAQIRRPPAPDTETLIGDLQANGWAVETFPGCTDSVDQYLQCEKANSWPADARKRVEGFGIAFRLKQYSNSRIAELIRYLNSPGFQRAIESKLGVIRRGTLNSW